MQWKLKTENIGGLRGTHNYEFEEDINVINAPNATGKSSVINSLRLALGGGDMDNLAKYINDSAESAEVELTDGEKYRVSLSRSGDEAKVLSRETPYDNQSIEDLVFLTEDSTLNEAVVEGDSELVGRWLSNVTEIEYYEIARDRAQSVMQDIKREKERVEDQVEGSVQEVNELIEELEEELEEVNEDINTILDSDEYTDIKSELEEKRTKKEELEDKVDEVSSKINKLQTEAQAAENTLQQKEEEKEELEDEIDELEKELMKGEQEIDDLREEVKDYDERISKLEQELEGKEEKRNGRTVTIEEGIKPRLKSKKKLLERRQGIEGFNECPKCGQALDKEEVKQEIEELKQEIEDLEDAKRKRERKIEDFRVERNSLSDEIQKIKEEIPEELEKKKDELSGVKKTIGNKQTEIEDKRGEISELEEKRDNLNEEVKEVEEEITELASQNEEKRDQLNSLYEREREIKDRLEKARERQAKYKRGTERLNVLERKHQVAEQVVKHFSDRIETVNVEMLGELNDALEKNFELLELADFEKIRVERERGGGFSIDLTRIDDAGRTTTTSLSELSGAERRLVALLIQYVAKKTFAPDIPLFVVDEVANAMDDERFHRVMDELSNELDTLIVTRNVPLEGEPETLQQKHIRTELGSVA